MLSSGPALRTFAELLSASREPDIRAVAQFMLAARDYGEAPASIRRRREMLEAPSVLAARQHLNLAYTLYRALPSGSREITRVADVALRRFDSRPRHLGWALWFSRGIYQDAARTRRLEEALAARDSLYQRALRNELAALRGDGELLWQILQEEDLGPSERLDVLRRIKDVPGFDRERLIREYEIEVARPAPLYDAFADYAALHSRTHDHLRASEVWRRFFDHPREFRGIDLAHAVSGIGGELRRAGRPEQAWEWLEPELDGYVGSVLVEATQAQIALGDLPRAEAIARSSVERYPGMWHFVRELALVLWLRGRHAEAAEQIASTKRLHTRTAELEIASAFGQAFAEPGGPAMLAAFRELVELRLPFDMLQSVIDELRSREKYDLAVELGMQMHDPKRYIMLCTEIYKSMALARGEAEALEWLSGTLDPSSVRVAAKLFYLRDADELLWTLTTDPEAGHGGAKTWLLRVAAHLRAEAPDPARHAVLVAHYTEHGVDSERLAEAGRETGAGGDLEGRSKGPQTGESNLGSKPSFEDRLGAALLGMGSEEDVLRSARDPNELCLAASFFGLRAEKEGRYEDALRLYQLGLTTPSRNSVEYLELRGGLRRIMDLWKKPQVTPREPRTAALTSKRLL